MIGKAETGDGLATPPAGGPTPFCPERRQFVTGLAALGASALGAAALIADRAAAAPHATPHRIDVHHHLSPPAYIAELSPKHMLLPPTLDWTPEKSLADMDKAGVATALLSITTPGLWFGDDEAARRLARACNEYAARLAADHPGRFGMFVALPLPDIEGSLREIAYGLDELKADGIGLFTSYGDKWLGDPAFAPVFEELNRRKAVVYTHPRTANCCTNLVPGIPDPAIEYGTDTTRAIARLCFAGAAARYGEIKLIFSHAGGTMPFLIERFTLLAKTPAMAERLPRGLMHELQKFNYDTAQASNPAAMVALRNVVPVSQILFGTDFPFRTAAEHVAGLQDCGAFSAAELRAVDRGNAVRLLPRYHS